MKFMLLTVALLCGALMAQNGPLANGLYAIEEDKSKAKSPVVRQYEGKDVVLDTATFAPLVLEGKPDLHRDPQGSWLSVQLVAASARRLEDLTRSHLNQRIAVVIGDKILSAPKVRTAITDGTARLTPCEDEACQALLRQLSK